MKKYLSIILAITTLLSYVHSNEKDSEELNIFNNSKIVYPNKEGKLIYKRLDQWGNTLPDYSYAGYKGGGVKLPFIKAKLDIYPDNDKVDDTKRLQEAIDKLSQLPLQKNGFRGALIIRKGRYYVKGQLKIHTSGIVIRGEGLGINDTVIHCTVKGSVQDLGWSFKGFKHKLFTVGIRNEKTPLPETITQITDEYLPLNTLSFTVANAGAYRVGDRIVVQNKANQKFRKYITGYPKFGEDNKTGGKRYIHGRWGNNTKGIENLPHPHERTITKISGNKITIDAPLYNPIAKAYGGAEIYKYNIKDRINNIGIENIRLVSDWEMKDGLDTLQHGQCAIVFQNCEDFWCRDVASYNFIGHHFSMQLGSKKGTFVDCSAINPALSFYEGLGYVARYGFNISEQCLIFRSYTYGMRHCFNSGVGGGPRVYLDCFGEANKGGPGPHLGFICGDLYDNVRVFDTELQISTRGQREWRGINCTLWNSGAASIVCMMPDQSHPPLGYNFAIGCYQLEGSKPKRVAAIRNFFRGKGELLLGEGPKVGRGIWESFGQIVSPRSLYEAQLEDRLGSSAVSNTRYQIEWGAQSFDILEDLDAEWISKDATYEMSSIVHQWSQYKDKFLNGQEFPKSFAFHTDEEANPYIIIDLKYTFRIQGMEIVNRISYEDKTEGLCAWISNDKKTWQKIWQPKEMKGVWVVNDKKMLAPNISGRYIKLGIENNEIKSLHLKSAKFYGEKL